MQTHSQLILLYIKSFRIECDSMDLQGQNLKDQYDATSLFDSFDLDLS